MAEEYQGIAAERGYLKVILGNEDVPMDALDIDQKVETKYLIPDEIIGNRNILQEREIRKGIETCISLCPNWPFNLYLLYRQKSFLMDH